MFFRTALALTPPVPVDIDDVFDVPPELDDAAPDEDEDEENAEE